MPNPIRQVTRSLVTRYVVVALLAYTLASPVQAFADSGLPALEERMAAAEAAITNLQTAVTNVLNQAKQYTDAQVASEATARQSADATLQANIDAEAAARASADTTLQDNINAEATARSNGDATTLAAAKAYTDAKSVGSLSVLRVIGPSVSMCSEFDVTCENGNLGTAEATCPSGYVATGGGFDKGFHVEVSASFPVPPTSWRVHAENHNPVFSESVRAYALCSKVTP